MARIHELLRQRESNTANAAFADDIEREFDALSSRRAFGLNFERHRPEEVDLTGRPVRTGDKVHVLPPRGTLPTAANSRLWRVTAIDGKGTTVSPVSRRIQFMTQRNSKCGTFRSCGRR